MSDIAVTQLPTDFINRITYTFGEPGIAWLEELPRLIKHCESQLNIKIDEHLRHLSHNYVATATLANGETAIIKFGAPSAEFNCEMQALELMQGSGIVKAITYAQEERFALLERLIPGEMLTTVSDDSEATEIAANIMTKLWQLTDVPNYFPTTIQWFERLQAPVNLPRNFSAALIDKAHHIASELHQDMGETVLLHGDLHHFNILSAEREPWLAIDPKGVIGEREYEIGAFLRNPIPDIADKMNTKKILEHRIIEFADLLRFDAKKIHTWGFAQAVLAAVWAIDGNTDDWHVFLKCATALGEIKV